MVARSVITGANGKPRSAGPSPIPVTTLKRGDRVVIHLRGRAIDRINAWAGEVVAVDGAAIRTAAHRSRFCLSHHAAGGERVIPWPRVGFVKIEGRR